MDLTACGLDYLYESQGSALCRRNKDDGVMRCLLRSVLLYNNLFLMFLFSGSHAGARAENRIDGQRQKLNGCSC